MVNGHRRFLDKGLAVIRFEADLYEHAFNEFMGKSQTSREGQKKSTRVLFKAIVIGEKLLNLIGLILRQFFNFSL